MKIGKYSFGTGDRFSHEGVSYPALEKHTDVIGDQIRENICERHIKRLFNK
ncbi:MAG: hypothetical protein MR414_04300 [Bacteroidales bacterium]|nr:hypothetical protein [Bacteroidales bacterium]